MTRCVLALLAWTFLSWEVLVVGAGPWVTEPNPSMVPDWVRRERVVLPTREACEAVARYMDFLVEVYDWGARPTSCHEKQ